jgi:hypothetical protein
LGDRSQVTFDRIQVDRIPDNGPAFDRIQVDRIPDNGPAFDRIQVDRIPDNGSRVGGGYDRSGAAARRNEPFAARRGERSNAARAGERSFRRGGAPERAY